MALAAVLQLLGFSASDVPVTEGAAMTADVGSRPLLVADAGTRALLGADDAGANKKEP